MLKFRAKCSHLSTVRLFTRMCVGMIYDNDDNADDDDDLMHI